MKDTQTYDVHVTWNQVYVCVDGGHCCGEVGVAQPACMYTVYVSPWSL